MKKLVLAALISFVSMPTFGVDAIHNKDGSTTYGDWKKISYTDSYMISTQEFGGGAKSLDIIFAPKLDCKPILTITDENKSGQTMLIAEVGITTTLQIDNHQAYIMEDGKQALTTMHSELSYMISWELMPTIAYGKIMSTQSDGDKNATYYSLKGSYAAIIDARSECLKEKAMSELHK